MATLRQLYFEFAKENNKYLRRNIIKELLKDTNRITSDFEYYKNIDSECVDEDVFRKKVEIIKSGYPYQYLLGYVDFLGYHINVNEDVLIPRQETEQLALSTKMMIQKHFPDADNLKIIDTCTGSGVLAVYLKINFPNAFVMADDIDEKCIKVAKNNAKEHNVDIEFKVGDLLQPYENMKDVNVIIANPPYIEDVNQIDEQVLRFEPHLALLAKPATLYYEKIFQQAQNILAKNAILAFEIDENMEDMLSTLVEKYFPISAYKFEKDIYNKTRFLSIIVKENKQYV